MQSAPSYEPTEEEKAQAKQARRDKIAAIQDQLSTESLVTRQLFGSRAMMPGSGFTLR